MPKNGSLVYGRGKGLACKTLYILSHFYGRILYNRRIKSYFDDF